MSPITREEALLGAIAAGSGSDLTPLTREERFLSAIANGTVAGVSPITRKEKILQSIIDSGGVGDGLKFDRGTFTFAEDVSAPTTTTIEHNLEEIPDIIIIWTDDFSRATESSPVPYSDVTMVGGSLLRSLAGLPQSLSSTYDARIPIGNVYTIPANGYKISYTTTNTSYGFTTEPTATAFTLPYHNVNAFWRAGVTYKYLVARGTW